MGLPRLLIDNQLSPRIYGLHTITANENSDNATLVASARRSATDGWTSLTPNIDNSLTALADRVRAVDMVVTDRDSNLAGETVRVQHSDDGFVTWQTSVDVVQPTTTGTGSMDDALGVRTTEGAWLKLFPVRAAAGHRFYIPAMGAGLVPQVSGLWLGLSWAPGHANRPFAPGITELVVEETESDMGWIGRGKATPRRRGVLRFEFASVFDGELAAWHLAHYALGRPMWIIPDDSRGDEAFLAVLPKVGEFGQIRAPQGRFYPTLDLPYVEHLPKETV